MKIPRDTPVGKWPRICNLGSVPMVVDSFETRLWETSAACGLSLKRPVGGSRRGRTEAATVSEVRKDNRKDAMFLDQIGKCLPFSQTRDSLAGAEYAERKRIMHETNKDWVLGNGLLLRLGGLDLHFRLW